MLGLTNNNGNVGTALNLNLRIFKLGTALGVNLFFLVFESLKIV